MTEVADTILRRETQVLLSEDRERYARAWLPKEPRRVLILIHGYGEHAGRYDEMAMFFAARGFAVHAYDQAGHGRTPGPRGHVDRFDRLVEEVARFVDQIALAHPGLPVTLVGHSMGGLVVAAAAAFLHPPVDRFVLSGALLRLGSGGGDLRQKLSLASARILSAVLPRFGLSTGLDADGISRDPEVVRRYRTDPYVFDRMTTRFAAGMSRLLGRMGSAAGRVERPILILHGAADPICGSAGSAAFFADLAAPIAEQSRLEIYPDLRHEIFQEPERFDVWGDMLSWLEDA